MQYKPQHAKQDIPGCTHKDQILQSALFPAKPDRLGLTWVGYRAVTVRLRTSCESCWVCTLQSIYPLIGLEGSNNTKAALRVAVEVLPAFSVIGRLP